MKIRICSMTTAEFLAVQKAGNLYGTVDTVILGAGYLFFCDGESLFFENTGVVSA